MAFGPFGRGRGGDDAPPPPSASGESSGGLTAFIDQGSDFEGKLSFKDTVRIDGHFRGEIKSENTLVVGHSGAVEATIRSRTVVIAGRVEGSVVAECQLVLHKTAVVDGDVETASLIVEDGAVINGRISMKEPGSVKRTPAPAPAQAAPIPTDGAAASSEEPGSKPKKPGTH